MIDDVVLKKPGGGCSRHSDKVAVGLIHERREHPSRGTIETTWRACRVCVHRAEVKLGREATT